MIEFHDYDIYHPFQIVDEKHVVTDGKIVLNYAPLKGSVTIADYTEDVTGRLSYATFYIDYNEEDNYRAANQIVRFSPDAEGHEVTITYKGVSTLLRAKHMNEIKDFMEHGASEMVAKLLVAHESALVNYLNARLEEVTAALVEIKNAILTVTEEGGGEAASPVIIVKPPKRPPQEISVASNEEYDEMMDEIFPDYKPPGKRSKQIQNHSVASDDEYDEMMDEIFPDVD